MEQRVGDKVKEALAIRDKIAQRDAMDDLRAVMLDALDDGEAESAEDFKEAFYGLVKKVTRSGVLDDRKRADGREFNEIRPITCEVGVAPRVHGSALFTRGETQAFVTTTLGTADDSKKMENYGGRVVEEVPTCTTTSRLSPSAKRVFCVARAGARSVTEHLAERAVEPVLPQDDDFPYVLRIVSDILESNGSSSMATVCGATLSLMDAGVPISGPVAGIAMGLMKEGDKYAILSDIAGEEDHNGDMDFKVAGTPRGITALQMDIKVDRACRVRSSRKRWNRRARVACTSCAR